MPEPIKVVKPTVKKPEDSTPDAAPAEPPPEVSISAPANQGVEITMLETVNPPPVVGVYNCLEKLGVTQMSRGAKYIVPKDVADVLADKKLCVRTA